MAVKKKAAAKKSPAKKVTKKPAKKTVKKVTKKPAKKPAKKVAKKTVKKAVAKKIPAKKVTKKAAKKVVAKKSPVKKVAKKAVKKVAVKKSPVKKVVAKKAPKKELAIVINNETHRVEIVSDVNKDESKSLENNSFLNLKIQKAKHEDPKTHHDDHEEKTEFEHPPLTPIVRDEPKVGRNEPCPCGSGKKYKKCCANE